MSSADNAPGVDNSDTPKPVDPPVTARICGDCTACCTVMAVFELKKANYEPCVHDCGRCAIYESRPQTCRNWSCSWLLGHITGDDRQRPNNLGLVFNEEQLGGKPIRVAYEVWPGAGWQPENVQLLRQMGQARPIVLREHQTRQCTVIGADAEARLAVGQLILDEWCLYGYSQCLIAHFYPSFVEQKRLPLRQGGFSLADMD